MDVVEEAVEIFEGYGIETQIIAASLRHPAHIREAALAGADIATVPYKVLVQAMRHPLTDAGVEKFLRDWNQVRGSGS
jgi:transaldolase